MTIAAEKITEAAAGPEKTADKGMDKRRALGRGLDSLLPSGPRVVAGADTRSRVAESGNAGGGPFDSAQGRSAPHEMVLPELQAQAARPAAGDQVMQISLDQIDENPYQTRHFSKQEEVESDDFVATTLHELAESIRANGVIQPIVVRPGNEGRYVLILGERRCRASKLAGKTTIPAIVRTVSEQQAAEMTVVENLQRQDLNCMEQANAFARLSKEFGLTQEQIGLRVGISRESVSNYMRLLKLPDSVRYYLDYGQLGFSEARVLLRVDDAKAVARIAETAVRKHLSVEQVEDLVMEFRMPLQTGEQTGRARWVDPNVRAAQRDLERVLGVKVRISDHKGKGKIVIQYANLADYDRVLGMLSGKK